MISLFKKKENNLPQFWKAYEGTFSEPIPEKVENVRFVVLDTETTGFNYSTDRMLCIGALILLNRTISIKEVFETYLQQKYYDKDTAKIHGILKKGKIKRVSEFEALQQFLAYIGNSVIVAHHANFDITMINKALKRQGLPKLKNKVLDTSTLYKRSLLATPLLHKKEHYTLDELAEKFSISKKDRHTAVGDAYITAIAFLKILDRLKPKKTKSLFYS
ncbi:DNA polymerase-3 subunit epsilon [Saonia flava]|uniref:DNA polymerase-3 subunit epsilon n=1 Tax=Saonia flava TaxID=523696 RepID=A0A846QQ66_9FLAO|nr:3'-5' exonuclease [Saonia flava]NJB70241.1 DNA polymerase-3 subunit epsilon [Saonia flava]